MNKKTIFSWHSRSIIFIVQREPTQLVSYRAKLLSIQLFAVCNGYIIAVTSFQYNFLLFFEFFSILKTKQKRKTQRMWKQRIIARTTLMLCYSCCCCQSISFFSSSFYCLKIGGEQMAFHICTIFFRFEFSMKFEFSFAV